MLCSVCLYFQIFVLSSQAASVGGSVRRGALPREMVCTENLTPWLKLLPCGERGLSRLLHAYRLYAGAYHSQAMRVRRRCLDAATTTRCATQSIELVTSISVVLPTHGGGGGAWTLASTFARPLERCTLARRSELLVAIDTEHVDQLLTAPTRVVDARALNLGAVLATSDSVAQYELMNGAKFDASSIGVRERDDSTTATTTATQQRRRIDSGGIVVQRAIVRDELTIELSRDADVNADVDVLSVVYYDALSWQMRLYAHTLRCALNGAPLALFSGAMPLRRVRLTPATHAAAAVDAQLISTTTALASLPPTMFEFEVDLRRGDQLICTVRL